MFKKLWVNSKAIAVVFILIVVGVIGYFIIILGTIAILAIVLFFVIRVLFFDLEDDDDK